MITLAQLDSFVTNWRRLKLTDEDLQALEAQIMADPERAPVIRGTGGLRKIRFAPPSWNVGKSGATRVCYLSIAVAGAVYLLAIYRKGEKDTLTAAEAAAFKRITDALNAAARREAEAEARADNRE